MKSGFASGNWSKFYLFRLNFKWIILPKNDVKKRQYLFSQKIRCVTFFTIAARTTRHDNKGYVCV